MRETLRIMVLGIVIGTCSAAWGADWHGAWGCRQQITVYSNQVSGSGTLTNFPVLITESNVQPGMWQYAQTNGNDILFTAADGVTKIPHELERYATGSSQLCAWVRLPQISAASNTIVYLYYGNPAATNQQNAAGVWDEYRAVWHLGEASGNEPDSTTNAITMVPTNGVTQNVTGRIGGAVQLDGTDDYLAASSTKYVIKSNATVSTWVWFDDVRSSTIIDSGYGEAVLITRGNNDLAACVRNGSGTVDAGYFTGLSGSWIYVSLVLENGTVRLYRNGAFRQEWTYSGDPSSTWANLGAYNIFYWKGKLDEVRTAKLTRSADWLATEYNNQNSPSTFAGSAAQETLTKDTAAWYNKWGYRQRLVIPGSGVSGSETLTNFPVLIVESNIEPGLWAHAQTNGYDILFTAADGVTKLPHEFERYDAVSSQLCAWVQMPQLCSASNKTFYMYYGQPAATNQQDSSGLWADYRAVWHLGESSGNDLDSTTNAIHAVPTNGVLQNVAGRIGGAVQCDGVNNYFTAGPVSGRNVVDGDGTISLWVRFEDGSVGTLFDTVYHQAVLMQKGGYGFSACVRSGSGTADSSYFTDKMGAWVYITMTLSGTNTYLYRNGEYRMSWGFTGVPQYSTAYFGANHTAAQFYNGKLDEIRSCKLVRSADWLTTEYNNQNAPGSFAYSFSEQAWIPTGTTFMFH